MENDDFFDPRFNNIVMTFRDGAQVEVANRAAREPPKLQMNVSLRVRQRDHLAGDCHQLAVGDKGADR
jgi:hypothetical protein